MVTQSEAHNAGVQHMLAQNAVLETSIDACRYRDLDGSCAVAMLIGLFQLSKPPTPLDCPASNS